MPVAQSRLASSSPFPIRPKGLNPSLRAPALRPPARPLLRRPSAPVRASRRRRCIPFRAARAPAPSGLCAPNASSTPTTAGYTPSARTTGGSAAGRRLPVRQRVLPPVSRLPDPAAAPAGTN
ncbi:hypothetical protein BS78_04G233700 [Paspalum vaginatum]|nr:hypothetical protein BS78_04G233700 [Paspalum vaginatum]